MTDTSLNAQLVDQLADAKVTAKMEELKQNLVNSLGGEKAEEPPKSWSSLKSDIKSQAVDEAVSKAEERILGKIAAERQAELDKQEALQVQTQTRTQEDANLEWVNQSNQWKDAVAAGIMPAIDPEVSVALTAWQNGGSAPTPEQMNDPGVKAFAEARALHAELVKSGKVNSFYGTLEKYASKQPAGASAPVLGNSTAVSSKRGYTAEEVRRENMSNSKWPEDRARR